MDVTAQHPELVTRFKAMIEGWKREMGMTERVAIH